MLRKFDWVLVVVIIAVAAWRFAANREDPGEDPGEMPPVQVEKPVPIVTVAPPAPVKAVPATEKAITAQRPLAIEPADVPRQPPKGMVEFEVKEGDMAIAFGDVVMGKVTSEAKLEKGITPAQRSKLWESNEIPFSIDKGVTDTAPIVEALKIYHEETSIRFVPYAGQKDSIVFVPSGEICASYLGRVGGAQPIFLSSQCGTNEVMHEIMHALGFVHEHSRPDRDQHVEVLWPNIDPKFWPQFYVVPDEQVHEYVGSVFSFDPESIMLYDSTAFAKSPGGQTLRSRGVSELKPSRRTLSRTDRERLFYLYGQ